VLNSTLLDKSSNNKIKFETCFSGKSVPTIVDEIDPSVFFNGNGTSMVIGPVCFVEKTSQNTVPTDLL